MNIQRNSLPYADFFYSFFYNKSVFWKYIPFAVESFDEPVALSGNLTAVEQVEQCAVGLLFDGSDAGQVDDVCHVAPDLDSLLVVHN